METSREDMMTTIARALAGAVVGLGLITGSAAAQAQSLPDQVELDGLLWRHTSWLNSVEFSPDGTRLLTASHDGTARVWDYETRKQLLIVGGDHGEVYTAHFSPDGTRILTTVRDGTVTVWDAETGDALLDLTVTSANGRAIAATSAAYSPDGTKIVASYFDNNARVFDAATGEVLHLLSGHSGLVWRAAFSPDGSRIVTISYDNTARLWDGETGDEIAVLPHDSLVGLAVFTPDGRFVATASADAKVRLWLLDNGAEIAEYVGHSQEVRSIAFTADGRRMVTASNDRSTKLWNVTSGEQLASMRKLDTDAAATAVAISADGSLIVIGYSDGQMTLRDGETGRLIADMVGHALEITDIVFSPDGTHVVTSSGDSHVLFWDLTPFE
jgi:WD40 repeat protein